MAKEPKRFVEVHNKGAFVNHKIIVDTQTRVQYLHTTSGYAGGLTVLVDRDGKPLLFTGHFDEK